MQSARDRSVGWTRAMSLDSVNSSTPSSVLVHSAVPADYHLIFARPPLFATEPTGSRTRSTHPVCNEPYGLLVQEVKAASVVSNKGNSVSKPEKINIRFSLSVSPQIKSCPPWRSMALPAPRTLLRPALLIYCSSLKSRIRFRSLGVIHWRQMRSRFFCLQYHHLTLLIAEESQPLNPFLNPVHREWHPHWFYHERSRRA